jgi:hypothetical protein
MYSDYLLESNSIDNHLVEISILNKKFYTDTHYLIYSDRIEYQLEGNINEDYLPLFISLFKDINLEQYSNSYPFQNFDIEVFLTFNLHNLVYQIAQSLYQKGRINLLTFNLYIYKHLFRWDEPNYKEVITNLTNRNIESLDILSYKEFFIYVLLCQFILQNPELIKVDIPKIRALLQLYLGKEGSIEFEPCTFILDIEAKIYEFYINIISPIIPIYWESKHKEIFIFNIRKEDIRGCKKFDLETIEYRIKETDKDLKIVKKITNKGLHINLNTKLITSIEEFIDYSLGSIDRSMEVIDEACIWKNHLISLA